VVLLFLLTATSRVAAQEHVTGSMQVARAGHTATELLSGKILVAGGEETGSAEIYDPVSDQWTLTGSMSVGRIDHTATLLEDGRVLVAGGDTTGTSGTAEIFDPAPGTWTGTGALMAPRMRHTAALLPSGQVLVAGGGTATAEIWDPQTGTWTQAESMSVSRDWHTATRLTSGEVLVVGGESEYFLDTAYSGSEIFDPVTGHWRSGGGLSILRSRHSAAPLSDGRVLVSGGQFISPHPMPPVKLDTAEIYDPTTNTWSLTGSMTQQRANATATLLPDARVLVVGSNFVAGYTNDFPETRITEIFDPATGTWKPDRELETGRVRHTTTVLSSGKVLVAGGASGPTGELASTELLDPLRLRVVPDSSLIPPRASVSFTATGGSGTGLHWDFQTNGSGATLTPDGHYTAGDKDQSTDVVRVTDSLGSIATATVTVVAGTWEAVGSMATERYNFPATDLKDGRVLVVSADVRGSAEIYDPTTRSWSDAGLASKPESTGPSLTLLDSGQVLLAGGCCQYGGGEPDAQAWLYDPSSRTIRDTGPMNNPRTSHAAIRLASGDVLVVGGDFGGTAEIFDPRTEMWNLTGQPHGPLEPRFSLTLLQSGKVLLAYPNGQTEVFDPSSQRWHPAGSMSVGRLGFVTVSLPSGKVLLVGGTPEVATPAPGPPQVFDPVRAELFDPLTETWAPTGMPNVARFSHSATLLGTGEVVVAGGWVVGGAATAGPLADTEIYNEVTGSFRLAGRLLEARSGHSATLLPSGKVLVAGGVGKQAQLKSAEEFDPPSPVATLPASGARSSGCHASGDVNAALLALLVVPFLVRRRSLKASR